MLLLRFLLFIYDLIACMVRGAESDDFVRSINSIFTYKQASLCAFSQSKRCNFNTEQNNVEMTGDSFT
jgi:hypothetical protein